VYSLMDISLDTFPYSGGVESRHQHDAQYVVRAHAWLLPVYECIALLSNGVL
jgi:hypothetical protein